MTAPAPAPTTPTASIATVTPGRVRHELAQAHSQAPLIITVTQADGTVHPAEVTAVTHRITNGKRMCVLHVREIEERKATTATKADTPAT